MGNSQSSGMPALQLSDPGKELLKSAERGETNVVALAIACNPLYLSHTSVFGGNTMWHKAAKTGKVEIFEALEQVLKQAFELEAKDLSNSRGSIRRLGSSSADVIRRMVNKANLKGVTPLMLACAGSHTEAVAWLLKNGESLSSCHAAVHQAPVWAGYSYAAACGSSYTMISNLPAWRACSTYKELFPASFRSCRC
eukprot:GHUV01028358.1.p1 GENE.GHUV01028358.1~~GHUV01028358.1.p1  ORF type:complete len:196 (+),score=53.56 GHUV01028358.1:349-936(+)